MLQLHNEMFYSLHHQFDVFLLIKIVYVRIYALAIGLLAIWGGTFVLHGTFPAMQEMLLRFSSSPDTAFLLFAFGALAVLVEFNRPGMIAPGVAGAFAMLLGAWTFLTHSASPAKIHSAALMGAGIPVLLAMMTLLYFAYIAHRNKRFRLP